MIEFRADPGQLRAPGDVQVRRAGRHVAALAGHRVDEIAVVGGHLDRAQLVEVAAHRRLRDVDAVLLQVRQQFGLGPDRDAARGSPRSAGGGRTWSWGSVMGLLVSASRIAGSRSRNDSRLRGARISGGASRIVSGRTAFTRKPCSRAARFDRGCDRIRQRDGAPQSDAAMSGHAAGPGPIDPGPRRARPPP